MTDTVRKDDRIQLEWGRLLGFDQISGSQRGAPAIVDARFSKIGGKTCTVITGR